MILFGSHNKSLCKITKVIIKKLSLLYDTVRQIHRD